MIRWLAGYCRRHWVSLAVLAACFGPFWYGAAVATVERFAYRLPIADSLLSPQVAIVDAGWYETLMVVGISVGLTYIFLLWWVCKHGSARHDRECARLFAIYAPSGSSSAGSGGLWTGSGCSK
jgi:hypothetical protein